MDVEVRPRCVTLEIHSHRTGASLGKASRRKKIEPETPIVTAARPPSTALIALACAALLALGAVPCGPFHAVPKATLWPLLVILCATILAGTPALAGRIPARLKKGTVAEVAGLFVIGSTWLLLKLVGLHASGTDDNIYFYLASRTADGAVPYRDFFFSHPPVHLLVPAAIFKVFGFSIGLAKLIPVMAQTIAGVFLYLTLRRSSVTMAMAGLFIHFMTYQVLMGSTDMNGENIMTMFLWVSAWAVATHRPLIGGIMSALAIGTGMYALAGVVAIGIMAFLDGWKRGVRFVASLLGVLAALFIAFRIIGGPGFTEGVFTYHTRKAVRGVGHESIFQTRNPFLMLKILLTNLAAFLKGDVFTKTFYYHGAIFLLAGVGGAVALLTKTVRKARFDTKNPGHLALVALVACALFMLQWAAVNEVYDFYLVPMFAMTAPAAAYAVYRAYVSICGVSSARGLVLPAAILAAAWMAFPSALHINAKLWPEEQAMKGQEVRYEWRDPEILKGPAQITRALFFADRRERGDVTPFFRHYMWNKSLAFSTAGDIAAHVQSSSGPEDTITGASTLAPLVALLAGRRMSGDEADTNGKRFNSGMLDEKAFIDTVCGDRVAFVISASNSYFPAKKMTEDPDFSSRFEPDRTFMDRRLKHFNEFPITVFRTRQGARCGSRQ